MNTFVKEIDQEFKSYNKFLRKENVEMRLKTSKRRKQSSLLSWRKRRQSSGRVSRKNKVSSSDASRK